MNKVSQLVLSATFCVCLQAAQLPVPLGSSANFAVLGGTTVTNTGTSIVTGNVGVSPGSAVTGFPPGMISSGSIHAADGTASTAQADLTVAYNNAAGRLTPTSLSSSINVPQTFSPGLYQATGSLNINANITLDGQGNANSVFIFQIGSTLVTASSVQILLIGSASPANVFWQVGSSATLGTGTSFQGTILALTSITLTTSASLAGRALARNGAVTLDTNAVVNPGPANVPPPLSVTCPSSSGRIGTPYSSSVVATGGTPPYTYSISFGTLPGLTLNPSTGALTGTPTGSPGNIFFSVNVVDSNLAPNGSECSLTNAPALPPPPTPAPPSLILVITGFAGTVVYQSRERLRQLLRIG